MERSCANASVEDTAQLVRRFSRRAVIAILALVIAGIIMIVALLERPISFTPYLQVLAVKIAIAAVVFALATYNKFRLTPRLLSLDSQAARSLRRAIQSELLLIGVVLATTAVLTTYQSPEG